MALTAAQIAAAQDFGQTGQGVRIGYRPYKASGAYTLLGTPMMITSPKYTVGEAETTLLMSNVKQYVPTLPDIESGFKLRYDPTDAGVLAIKAALRSSPVPLFDFQILDVDGSSETFSGFFKSFEPDDYELENARTATVSIRVNTAPVQVAAPTGP